MPPKKSSYIKDLYTAMVQLRECMKMCHLQTKSYDLHLLTDNFLVEYDKLFDAYWETLQGNKFRLDFGISLEIPPVKTYNDLIGYLEGVERGLIGFDSDISLNASRDAILELINRFNYLNTFS